MIFRRFVFTLVVSVTCLGRGFEPAQAFDVLVLVDDPQPLKCRIDGLGDDFIVARVAIDIAGKTTTAKRSFKLAQVDFIDFEVPDSEAKLLAEEADRASLPALRDLWESKSKWLSVRRSNAGEVGLAVAHALLATEEPAKLKVALDTFKAVEKGDWKGSRKALAQQGRLRTLLALDRPDEALAEAETIAAEAEDSTILVETRLVMAVASQKRFEASLEEFPKWREDDEVREKVMAQFHAAIDQFLYPCLFHGSIEEPAARGLWRASQVYELAGETDAATDCARDIVALYPESTFAERSRQFIANEGKKSEGSR